jgi:hypothetical protein
MTLGELVIFVFVALVFAGGIYGGVRLFKWNQRDRDAMQKRNDDKGALDDNEI